jgi:tetratricopeptide (TPR) repeat protein
LTGFIFIGIFIGVAAEKNFSGSFKLSLFKESGLGFISGLVLIFFIIVSVSALYFLSGKYLAAVYFQKGISFLNAGNLNEAKNKIAKAVNLDPRDRYYRALVQVNLIELNQAVLRTDLPPAEFRQALQVVLSQAIQNAQSAQQTGPAEPLNRIFLGQLYESLVPLQIGQALELSRINYAAAAENFPNDPAIAFLQARIEMQSQNFAEARKFLDRAILLKPDYTEAHFLYGQLELQSGNLKAAIQRAETATFLNPNDIGTLFQLGFMYYQDKEFQKAKRVFEQAVSLNPNYSNARYFLGLIYDREGKVGRALEEFQKIQALNPQNAEVKKIISNLKLGRPALAEISPPEKKPEERKEPPVK